jgi:peptidoglycan/xylan/chitin deacetylase (PgdA/CDA1 family)
MEAEAPIVLKKLLAGKRGRPCNRKNEIGGIQPRRFSGQGPYREFFQLILPFTLIFIVICATLLWVVDQVWLTPDNPNKKIISDNEKESADKDTGESVAEGPIVALTFDDGPNEKITPLLLDALEARGVKATFFVIGVNAAAYPDILKQAYDSGHLICSHTCDHVSLTGLDETGLADQINNTVKIIQDIIGEAPRYLRPPLAAINKAIAAQIDCPIMLWTVDPRDWESRNADTVYKNIMDNIYDGAVIILHDRFPSTVEAVSRVIDTLLEEGWCFVTLDEYYQYYNMELVAGHVYRGTMEVLFD